MYQLYILECSSYRFHGTLKSWLYLSNVAGPESVFIIKPFTKPAKGEPAERFTIFQVRIASFDRNVELNRRVNRVGYVHVATYGDDIFDDFKLKIVH